MNRLKLFELAFDCQNESNPNKPDMTPPCREQPPFTFRGISRQFPHLTADR
jgi:hypothetical protein